MTMRPPSLSRPCARVLSRAARFRQRVTRLEDRLMALVLTVALLGLANDLPRAAAQTEPKDPPKLPDGLTNVTKEHLLTKVPNFFCFDYQGQRNPGKRMWLRIDDGQF